MADTWGGKHSNSNFPPSLIQCEDFRNEDVLGGYEDDIPHEDDEDEERWPTLGEESIPTPTFPPP